MISYVTEVNSLNPLTFRASKFRKKYFQQQEYKLEQHRKARPRIKVYRKTINNQSLHHFGEVKAPPEHDELRSAPDMLESLNSIFEPNCQPHFINQISRNVIAWPPAVVLEQRDRLAFHRHYVNKA